TERHPVAWFQGRMAFGPRALGGRSIIGCPSVPGVSDRINEQIKYRERWRPFCPSMLDTVAPQMLKVDHPSPFMTFTFEVNEDWKERVPEVVHEDGTSRAQVLKREDRKSTRLNSSHVSISYAVFCLKKKNRTRAEREQKT